MDKILELCKKLKALADRGVDGEKQNAVVMLQKLMKKHSITMDIINNNESKKREFRIDLPRKKFFLQIVSSVLGLNYQMSYYRVDKSKHKHIFILCTPSEAIEIQARFDFFWRAWENELEVFYSAFVQTQKIYAKPSEDDNREQKELTPEEEAKLRKTLGLMQTMERYIFQKQIGQ